MDRVEEAEGPSVATTGPLPWETAGDGFPSTCGEISGGVQADLSGFAAATWVPHDYQRRAVEWLATRPEGALFLPPGMGKTSCSLEAFNTLRNMGHVKRMLVLAPLKVCETTWQAEPQKWFQFQGLKVGFAHGPEKHLTLKDEYYDIVLLNYDGLEWASKLLKPGMFDVLLCDEITRLKNSRSKRFAAIKPVLPVFKFRWGLTGTPAANGLLDLFGQVYVLDLGRRLSRFITHFRAKYFHQKPRDEYRWYITPEKSELLIHQISDLAMYLDPKEWLSLPELMHIPLPVQMPKEVRDQYEQLEDEFIIMLESGAVTAVNAGVLTAKLRQFTGGAVYYNFPEWQYLHDAKLDRLSELVEEMAGEPLIVAYMFDHELQRLQERFKNSVALRGGMTSAATKAVVEMWNSGDIPILFVQPTSAAYGLNLQFGGSAICWFTLTYNLEEYQQLIARLWRQGQVKHVRNYLLMMEGTIDARVAKVLIQKDIVQADLFNALR